jgi:predicted GNAT family N-acyltransferase
MLLLEPEQRRLLGFIQACNRSGYQPTREEVELWLESPTARRGGMTVPALHSAVKTLAEGIRSASGGEFVAGEGIVDHAIKIKWIIGHDRVRLTALGQALLTDYEKIDDYDETPVVVLKSDDQLAYARLVGELAKTGRSFLVDPYFRLDQFQVVVETTEIARILISKQYKGSKEARAALRIALNTLPGLRSIEIRATDSLSLHDRIIIADTGQVYSLGASLNSIGTVTTVYMPLPEVAAAPLKNAAETWWEAAEVVGPIPDATEESGTDQ